MEVVAFAFFVPVIYHPPFQEMFKTPAGAYLVLITYFFTGYGRTYYCNTYQVQF